MSELGKMLGALSGGGELKLSEHLLFDKVIGFKGLANGVGTSTVVQNVAIALNKRTNNTVCVVDMSYLQPIQSKLLGGTPKDKDIISYSGNVSDIVEATNYQSVYVVGFNNRTIVDMLSSTDSESTISNVIDGLKEFFDIILVDLSTELTTVNTYASVKCNKIITVADQSMKCMSNIIKTQNTLATLGLPPSKYKRVVLNKVVKNLVTDTKGVLTRSSFNVIGEILHSDEVLQNGVVGKESYLPDSVDGDIAVFTNVINNIVDDILGVHGFEEVAIPKETKEESNNETLIIEDIDVDIDEEIEL